MTDNGDDASTVFLAALLPAIALVWASATGGGYSAARVAFVLTGLTAMLIHLVSGERWRTPARAIPLAAAAGASLAAAFVVTSHGEIALGARAALASTTALAMTLAVPPLASGSQVRWRLWLMITCLALLTDPVPALPLVIVAIVWWAGDRFWTSCGRVDADPTVAELCAPVSNEPGADTPVVNGSTPITVVERLLDDHPRVLVQVGDLVIGELSRSRRPFPASENPA